MSRRLFLFVLCLSGMLNFSPASAESNEEILQRLQNLNADATASYQSGDFARAADVGLKAAELFLTVGPSDHFAYGNILHNLGMSHLALGNYQFATPLLIRALEIAEKANGPESEAVANRLNSLGNLYIDTGEYTKAEPQLLRSLALWQKLKGEASRDAGRVLNNLGALYRDMARYEDAVSVLERARDIHSNPASAGDAAGAAGLIGPEGMELMGAAQNNLALAQEQMGDFGAAEKTYQRAIAQQMLGLGGDSAALAITYSNFASLLARGGHFGDAEAYGKRAVEELTKRRGAAHPDVATAINNLAGIYSSWGKPAAFPLYRDALAIREKAFGPDHPDVADSLNSLGLLAIEQGQVEEATALITRALEVRRKVLGESHPSTANTINNLAAAYFASDRLPEAVERFSQSLALLRAAYGEDHPRIADGEANLGDVRFRQQDWRGAAAHFETAMNILSRRTAAAGGKLGGELDGKAAASVLQASPYAGALKAYHRLPDAERAAAIGKAFTASQAMSNSSAAASLAQMAARQSLGDPRLSALVRERQDITAEWRAADDRMLAITSLPMEQRNGEETTRLQNRQSEIAARLSTIDGTLISEFPDYMSLANPQPASIERIQLALKPGEAALIYADAAENRAAPGETFVFAITSTSASWTKLAEPPEGIANRVRSLRSLLGVSGTERGATAAEDDNEDGAFDLSEAHALYNILLGPIAADIAGRELIIMPSPALSALPFHLLLSAAPQSDEPSQAHWLVIDHAISYLPSATSLTSLRRDARPSAAARPYLGIGNPLLLGSAGDDRRAFDVKGCGTRPAIVQIAAATSIPPAGQFFRGKLADVERVARLAPLPETTDELCAVADSLRGGDGSVILGADATETRIRAASASGELAQVRILHFATHGLVTGELNGLAEPALVLTPPPEATAADDGLLTASEVSALQLDADWVILSACNTAAGEGGNAEALSGLARSFFYAGARALLVSHWPVNSVAAVELTTAAVRKLEDGSTSRAEALRQAMLAQIAQGGARADPAYWGPFVVIGADG